MKITVGVFITLCLFSLGVTSCGKKNISANLKDTLDTTQTQELFVWVENARVRKSADLNGEIISEIKGGEKVVLTGETSDNKIKVNLRGVEIEDVWVKVKLTDGKEGWIFKGMLTENETRAQAMNNFLIAPGKGVGSINVGMKQKEVEDIFGKQFILSGIIYGPEGIEMPGFYVFKNSPLELQCVVDETDSIISIIKIIQPGGNWATEDGIKIGTTLDQLVSLNGTQPITFSGFGWDYGGNVHQYNGGKLQKLDGKMSIGLGEPDDITGLDEFMGDTDCSTRNKKILKKGVKVAEINIFAPADI